MRFLHLSDLHIGKHVNEFPMLEDQKHALEQVIALLEKGTADALVIAGDVYDKSAPSAEAVALLDWFLERVADTHTPCLMIAGNHDSAERIAFGETFFAKRGVHVSPVYDGTLKSVTLEDEHGPVTFWLMPFLKPSMVRPHFPDAEIGSDYTLACKAALDACPIDPQCRNVLIAHQFVTSSSTETIRTDSELTLGGTDNVNAAIFDQFSYVALGHVHRPQRVGREETRYSGSLLKYSISEAHYPKSIPLVTLDAEGNAAIEFIPIEPLHDLREIKGPLAQLVSPEVTDILDGKSKMDYLHVTLTDEEPPLNALGTLRAVYPNVMALDFDNARTKAAGVAGSTAQCADEHLDLPLAFNEFYEKQNGAPLTDEQLALVTGALSE